MSDRGALNAAEIRNFKNKSNLERRVRGQKIKKQIVEVMRAGGEKLFFSSAVF